MYRTGLHRRQALTGLFSPRFRTKTKITGVEFIAFVEADPGADVYMINPNPHFAYLTYNVWMQGAWAHPGIMGPAQALLNASGIDWNLAETPRHGPDTMCYSNFWIGSEKFWDDYVGGILIPIAEFLEAEPESDVARAVMTNTRHYEPTPFLPFIVERLFSTYLSLKRPSVRPYLLDPVASCVNEFDRDIVMFLRSSIVQADRDGAFPDDLRQWMQLLRKLRRRFSIAHYVTHPQPNTGKMLTPEAVEAAMRDLSREVVAEPLK
jgi:hypothetical protein